MRTVSFADFGHESEHAFTSLQFLENIEQFLDQVVLLNPDRRAVVRLVKSENANSVEVDHKLLERECFAKVLRHDAAISRVICQLDGLTPQPNGLLNRVPHVESKLAVDDVWTEPKVFQKRNTRLK